MKRKKYVKYLMGQGLPRNKAVLFAGALRESKIPYKYCEVEGVIKCSDGSHRGICLFSRAATSMILPKTVCRVETGLSESNVKFFLYSTAVPIAESRPISELQIGKEAKYTGIWNYPSQTQWLRSGEPFPDFPTTKAYSTNEYRPVPKIAF